MAGGDYVAERLRDALSCCRVWPILFFKASFRLSSIGGGGTSTGSSLHELSLYGHDHGCPDKHLL